MKAEIQADEIMREVVMEVKIIGLKEYKLRWKIAYWLCWLASKVAKIELKIIAG